ncbi:MAG: polysaccharide biosynthesis tyrosine autokinase [Microbacterium sp.]
MKQDTSGWTLARIWDALKKFWAIILALTVLGGLVGFGLSASVTPIFQSTATLFFSLSQGNSASDLNQGSTYTQNQMLSFAQLATSSLVLEPVIDELDLDTTPRLLARTIEVTNPLNTVILQIESSSPDPELAADIANAVADSLTEVVEEVSPKSADGAATISAKLVDEAVVPAVQALPNKTRDAVLGAAVGFLLGILAAILWTLLDTRVPNETVLGEVVSAPILGSVSRVRGANERGLYVAREPLGRTSEEFRRIRSALSYAGVSDRVQKLLITSVNPGEGKSTFSSNLALTLAGLRHNVLIVDADLRRPRVAEYFGVEGSVGLTTVLVGEVSFDNAKITRPGTTLDILPSGVIPPNPAEMLTSDAMRHLLDEAAARYDFIIIDSPPVLSVADANLLAPSADGAIIVVDASKTRRTPLAHAVTSLESSGGRIVGMVLNKVRASGKRSAYYAEDGADTSAGPV